MAEFSQFGPIRRIVVLQVVRSAKLDVEMLSVDKLQDSGVEADLRVALEPAVLLCYARMSERGSHTLSRVIGSIRGEMPEKKAFIHQL